MTAPIAIPQALRMLWKQRTVSLVTNVAIGSREHREIAHASSLIRQDYHDRFLIELLQNANDQALLGGLQDTIVIIVRSADLLAVSNNGQVLTQRNLERLSSLADSDKPGELVGNKGVGFKAVYQVADEPEVYSAAERGADQSDGSLFSNFGVGIALSQKPFDDVSLVQAMDEDIGAFLEGNTGLAASLANKTSISPVDAVRAELPFVAGFKFPVTRSKEDLAARIASLGKDITWPHDIKTLVVLPLRDDRASSDVERVLDRLVGQDSKETPPAGLAVLFLQGIAKIVVIDQVRTRRWSFSGRVKAARGALQEITISTSTNEGKNNESAFWTLRRDIYAASESLALARRSVVEEAIQDFEIEGWNVSDVIPVAVALPLHRGHKPAALGPPGRFCVGLPTEKWTGLPAHVDARFFATISRTGLDFGIAYNRLLLDVAAEIFGEILCELRRSESLLERRTATLALQRSSGALGDRVYTLGGVADEAVVLSWNGVSFQRRQHCRLPDVQESKLLFAMRPDLTMEGGPGAVLPESGLLEHAPDVLQTLDLGALRTAPHPWLTCYQDAPSVIERAAKQHRSAGPQFWEPFVEALLECFDPAMLMDRVWMPVGSEGLAAPNEKVFLPARADSSTDDDEEVASVPVSVAARIRLLDESALQLRKDGRQLTGLASKLVSGRLARPPRMLELLEDALFPAVAEAAKREDDLSLRLFGQGLTWISSMRDISRQELDCRQALVPVQSTRGDRCNWIPASRAYLGSGWGLDEAQDALLEQAYPTRRLMPLAALRESLGVDEESVEDWPTAVALLGVSAWPRILQYPSRPPPLYSSDLRLYLGNIQTFEDQTLQDIYSKYIHFLAGYPTRWSHWLAHDVEHCYWIDGLERPETRPAIVELLLRNSAHFRAASQDLLGRVGRHPKEWVPSMWAFALEKLGWTVFPAEFGVGREKRLVSAGTLWVLPEGARITGYARLLEVVPIEFAEAGTLLNAIGVPTLETASLDRLLQALGDLARRLDQECLNTRPEALSLANELYSRIHQRLILDATQRAPINVSVPLIRDRRLEAVHPSDKGVVIVFDDDPARAHHIHGLGRAHRVPVSRDTDIAKLHDLFVQTWGPARVVRTSTAAIDLRFKPVPEGEEPFLSWLQRTYPHQDAIAELAALLTFGGERMVRAEPVSRHWKYFDRLRVVRGAFEDGETLSFYERQADLLQVSCSLDPHEVVARTWELAGPRSRDLLAAYADALRDSRSREFLRDRGISDVEIVEVADEAGLHSAASTDNLAPALLAARVHLAPGTTLDTAAKWLGSIGNAPSDIAKAFGREDLAALIEEAMMLRPPDGEIALVRKIGVPWALWQDARMRQDGRRFEFRDSISRYEELRDHWVAVVRELGVRDGAIKLEQLGSGINAVVTSPVPESVRHRPVDVAEADRIAWHAVQSAVRAFPSIKAAVSNVSAPPWHDALPVPEIATRRGVRLFRDVRATERAIDAATSVEAVISVGTRLASLYGENIGRETVLSDANLSARMRGEWAHVYSALMTLRPLLEAEAPSAARRLTEVLAFRESTTVPALLSKLPEVPRSQAELPRPKQTVFGTDWTPEALREDLAAGSSGGLGSKIVAAAKIGIAPDLLGRERAVLPPGRPGGLPGHRPKSSGKRHAKQRREPELIGDLGEAFVHEWLTMTLGAHYGPDCWRSSARERYGFPPSGDDDVGYDFRVTDPEGKILTKLVKTLLLEVKATSTDGSGPFPMSRAEWDKAREAHESGEDALYVIVRVCFVDTEPRIGDVIVDPFSEHRKGTIRLADRDLWVTVGARVEANAETTLHVEGKQA